MTKDKIIALMEEQGYSLVEVQYHLDGNHLLFEKDGEVVSRDFSRLEDVVSELDDLKARVEKLESR